MVTGYPIDGRLEQAIDAIKGLEQRINILEEKVKAINTARNLTTHGAEEQDDFTCEYCKAPLNKWHQPGCPNE